MTSFPFIHVLAVVGLVGAAGAEIAGLAQRGVPDPRHDPVRMAEERWAPIRAQLAAAGPPGAIGYEGLAAGQVVFRDPQLTERFYRAQFELVPWVLSPDCHQGWVILDQPGRAPRLFHR